MRNLEPTRNPRLLSAMIQGAGQRSDSPPTGTARPPGALRLSSVVSPAVRPDRRLGKESLLVNKPLCAQWFVHQQRFFAESPVGSDRRADHTRKTQRARRSRRTGWRGIAALSGALNHGRQQPWIARGFQVSHFDVLEEFFGAKWVIFDSWKELSGLLRDAREPENPAFEPEKRAFLPRQRTFLQ